MKSLRALCWCAPLLLIGCAVGADFEPPEPNLPESFHGKGPGSEQTAIAAKTDEEKKTLATWWENFNDPLLPALIAGIPANLDYQTALARVRAARANLGIAIGGLLPTLDFSGIGRRNKNAGTVVAGSSGGAVPGVVTASSAGATNLFQAGFDAAWEIDIFGGRRREIEAATADLESSREDARAVMVTATAELASSYITLRGIQKRLQLAERTYDAQIRAANVIRDRFNVGFVSRLDLTNAEVQAVRTKAQIPPLRAQEEKLIYAVAVLLGRNPNELYVELKANTGLPTPPKFVPIGVPSELARRRPDIRKAEAALHAATARTGVAVSDLFPKFGLNGSFGYRDRDAESVISWANRFWALGSTVRWPIFDGGRIVATIELRNAQEAQAFLQYRKVVLSALQEVENALTDYANQQTHREALAESVALSRQAVSLATQQYNDGLSDYLNVVTAQQSLYAAEDALTQNEQATASTIVALYKALGGGWTLGSDLVAKP